MKESFTDEFPQLSRDYHSSFIKRRIRISKIVITALRSGADIFTMAVDDLTASSSLFLTALTRGKGINPWGETRVAALAHLGDSFYALHYVCPGIGMVNTTNELAVFNNQTAQFHNARRGFIFAGESYQSVLEELNAHPEDTDSKQVCYGQAYRQLQMPVHLLSCDDTGAMQLKIMSVPDYRSVFARAALEPLYTPPPKDVPVWDGLYKGVPFVMAADMDLRRADAALELALTRGHEKIAIVGLAGQAKSILVPRYKLSGKADVFTFTDGTLNAVLGDRAKLYVPPPTQYLTEKGEVVYAPAVKAVRKAGGYHHK